VTTTRREGGPWSRTAAAAETLEHLIHRVCTDAQTVGVEMTPEKLADAIRGAGWRKINRRG
jgi:hypothetical protein